MGQTEPAESTLNWNELMDIFLAFKGRSGPRNDIFTIFEKFKIIHN